MAGPLGPVIDRAFTLRYRQKVGFPLPPAEGLPADLVTAIEILHSEQRDFDGESSSRQQEVDAVKRELSKRG